MYINAKNYENWLAVDKAIAKISRLTFLAHPVTVTRSLYSLNTHETEINRSSGNDGWQSYIRLPQACSHWGNQHFLPIFHPFTDPDYPVHYRAGLVFPGAL